MKLTSAQAQWQYAMRENLFSHDSERFEFAYALGLKKEALCYIDRIDVNYDNGYLLILAAQKVDADMLARLLAKQPKVGLQAALTSAAIEHSSECLDILISYGADPRLLKGTTAYYAMKDYFDKKTAES